MKLKLLFLFSPLLLIGSSAIAQDSTAAKGKLSGEAYYEYFYNIQQRDTSKKDFQGFQFRRIYFTYDHPITSQFDARVRFEADGNELTSGGKLTTFMKEAYLKWKNVFQGSDLAAGLSVTPTWEISEVNFWVYRSLEKTIMDLRGIAPRTDLSLDLKGKITEDGVVNYWIKVGDNSGQKPETDKYKRYYGLLHLKPSSKLQMTVYADYDAEPKKLDSFDGQSKENNKLTFAGFVGYRDENKASVGLEGFYRVIQNNYTVSPTTSALANQGVYGVSAFGWISLQDDIRLIGRFDVYDPNTSVDKDGVYYILGALDYMPGKDVHIMPNLFIQSYQADVANDIVARVTLHYIFK